MTSEQTNPTPDESGTAQASKGKEKERALKTSSKKGITDARNSHMVVGSRKLLNLLFSQWEDF
jgi:hypothetical protein